MTPPIPVAARRALAAPLRLLASPALAPWRGDLLRAVVAPAVAVAATGVPGWLRTVPTEAVLLVAGAYLLLVVTTALGRLDGGLAVPAGVVLAVDALHLAWGAHLTSGLGGPVPLVAAAAATCLLLRLVLLPPAPARPAPRGDARAAAGRGSAARPAPVPPRPGRAQRERLEVAGPQG